MVLNALLLSSYLILLAAGVYLTGLRLIGDWLTALIFLLVWPALVGLSVALRLRLAFGRVAGIGLIALAVLSPWLTVLLARPLLPMIRACHIAATTERIRRETLKVQQANQTRFESLFARPQRVVRVVDRYLIIQGGYALDLYGVTLTPDAALPEPPRSDDNLAFLGPLLTGKCVGVRLPDDFTYAHLSGSYVTFPFRTRSIPDIPVLVYLDGGLINALVRERLGRPPDPLLTDYGTRYGPAMAEIHEGDCGT